MENWDLAHNLIEVKNWYCISYITRSTAGEAFRPKTHSKNSNHNTPTIIFRQMYKKIESDLDQDFFILGRIVAWNNLYFPTKQEITFTTAGKPQVGIIRKYWLWIYNFMH